MKRIVFGAVCLLAGAVCADPVTTGEALLKAIADASATEPSVIEVAAGDIYLTATLNLTKPITVRGAGIGKTVVMRDSSLTQLRLLEISNKDASAEGLTFKNGYLNAGSAAGAYVTAGTVRRCEFINCHNQPWNTGWNQGGGVKLTGSNSKLIACVIRDMTVGDGQGEALWVEKSAVAESCLVCDNKCTTTGRASAYMVYCSGGTLRGCTIVNNYMGNSVALYNFSGTIKDCIVYGNTGSIATSGGLGNGFDIAGSTGASSVINTLVTDPGFVDFANKNYALGPGPAIDAAQYGPDTLGLTAVDAAGNPRQAGTAVDIGALECPQTSPDCAFIAAKTTVLENEDAALRLYAVGAGDTPEFTVLFGDGTTVVTTERTVTHAYAHAGVYTVTVSIPGVMPKTGTITVKPKNLYVKEGGTGAPPYASEDQAAGYIEDALAEAGDDCVIWLAKGDYTLKTKTPIEVKKGVTIRGATGRPEDVKVTRISGGSRPFTLNNAKAVLADLTVYGGALPAQYDHGANIRILSTGGMVTNCIIRNGSSGSDSTGGGGVALQGGLVTHCIITNNYGYENGAGVYMSDGRVENCLIVRNDSGSGSHNEGGAVCMDGGKLVNCTIANNTATRCPSICFMSANSKTIVNCLFFGNTSRSLSSDTLCVYVTHTGGTTGSFTACAAPFQINNSCFTADDLMVNADYRPMAKSVCRDNATTAGITVPATDLAGNPRLDEETGLLDIGCYEFHSTGLTASISSVPVAASGTISGLTPLAVVFTAETDGGDVAAYRWFVNGIEQQGETEATFATNFTASGTCLVTLKVSDGSQDYDADNALTVKAYPPVLHVDKASSNPVAPYETEETAATFLEDALAAAFDGCEIRIAPATYPAKSGAITVGKGVTIRGMGAKPTDVVLKRKDKSTNHRILGINHESCLVTGLTIDNGYLTGQFNHGAGVFIEGRGGTVSNCVIRNCQAMDSDVYGGGACLTAANALLTHCVITNCAISTASPSGREDHGGHGVFMKNGAVRDSLVAFCGSGGTGYDSRFMGQDGAIAILGGQVINCTVASNASSTCAGIRARGGKVINTIISANRVTTDVFGETARVAAFRYKDENGAWKTGTTTFDHCLADTDVDGKFTVEDAGQTFLRPGSGNFRLRTGSKAVDAGDVSAVTSAVDLRGNPRIQCGAVDIGCYENQSAGLTLLVR